MKQHDIEVLKRVQKESITFTDILGEHTGIIHTLSITDNGIYAYALFLGQNLNFRFNEVYMQWEKIKE